MRNVKRKMLALTVCLAAFVTPAAAQVSQEEVFRSIEHSMSRSSEPTRVMILVLAGAVLVIILLLVKSRQDKGSEPRPVCHQGKLLKEVAKSANLKSSEVQQLKALAEQLDEHQGTPVTNPLTLVLCPSLLAKAIESRKASQDNSASPQ